MVEIPRHIIFFCTFATCMKQLFKYISDHVGVLVLLTAVAAYLFPATFSFLPTTSISYMLGVVMFGMGLALSPHDFQVVFSRPRDVLIGTIAQFAIMPCIAWILAKAFALDNALALGVILVGCCPGGTASNVITFLAKGDLALSVGITGVSTLLAPLLTPLLTWGLAGERIEVDVLSMFLSILWVVIVPIILGFAVKKFFPNFTSKAIDFLPGASTIAIAMIVSIVISANASRLMVGGVVILLVVMLHNICGLLLGYTASTLLHMPLAKRKTIAIEVGMQNSGLAAHLAALHFAMYPLATIPGAIFSVWHNLSGAVVARYFSRRE